MGTIDVTAAIQLAEQFGKFIAGGNYSAAHGLLSEEARRIYSPHHFRWAIEELVGEAPGIIHEVEVSDHFETNAEPTIQETDIGTVLVVLVGDSFEEPVALRLTDESGAIRIRFGPLGKILRQLTGFLSGVTKSVDSQKIS